MANDMVVDHNMYPAYINTPDRVKAWLKYQLEQGYSLPGYQVRVGSTMTHVSLPYYLRGAKIKKEKDE